MRTVVDVGIGNNCVERKLSEHSRLRAVVNLEFADWCAHKRRSNMDRRQATEGKITAAAITLAGQAEDWSDLRLLDHCGKDGIIENTVSSVVFGWVSARERSGKIRICQTKQTARHVVAGPVSAVNEGDLLIFGSYSSNSDILVPKATE